MTTPVPGPAASVLAAILVTNPNDPGSPPSQATFSQSGEPPVLPSLMNDVVVMPQDGLLDANGTWTGFLSTQGLTGATTPTRWVGATAAGEPQTGTFAAGDFVVSLDGNVYICTAAGSPGTWSSGSMSIQATTGITGYTLINGTANIISWTAPNDGEMHEFNATAVLHVSSPETGGSIQVAWTTPDGTSTTTSLFAGGQSGVQSASQRKLVEGNTTVTVQQNTALTGGAAVVWVNLWGV